MAEHTKVKHTEQIARFVRQWQRRLLLRQAVLALIPALACFFVLQFWLSAGLSLALSLALWLLTGFVLYLRRPYSALNQQVVLAWLDQQHPTLQYSSALLLSQPADLTVAARVQRRRMAADLEQVLHHQKPPVTLQGPLYSLALVFLAGLLLTAVWQPKLVVPASFFATLPAEAEDSASEQTRKVQRALPELQEGRLRLAPPAYTGQQARFFALGDLEAPQGSRLTWQLRFNKAVNKVFLTDQQNDTLHFTQTAKGAWVAQRSAAAAFFYRLGYATSTDTAYSPFMKVNVLADQPPRLSINKPEQYLLAQQGEAFEVWLEAADDYGLEDLYLSLTISRGSGENVNFREEKIWVDMPRGSRKVKEQLKISPAALGMQPGDELYYRLEAHDNKPPKGQHRRSNSWYYQWQDTAAAVSALSSGLALDVEPEYFRSQRQIIIDTEKLISTQQSVPVPKWEKANQDLAVDQKLLRLRYGKFLGEEFESTAGGVIGPDEEKAEDHDHEEEAHAHEAEEAHHEHTGHEAPAGDAGGSLLEMFGHAHDTEEGATFYEESIKVKLKAALAQMWEAEKYLRLSQPRQALPYEYQALKMIKEVQQSSRIYVERVGLELPVLITQEWRLKGKLDDVRPAAQQGSQQLQDTLRGTRQLLNRLSYWEKGQRLNVAEQQLLRQTSKEVARLIMVGGPYMQYFYLLNILNELQEKDMPQPAQLQKLQKGLYAILPARPRPAVPELPLSSAQKLFLKKQSKEKRD